MSTASLANQLAHVLNALFWDTEDIEAYKAEHQVVSDGQLVVHSNNEGVPFVLANPVARVSQDLAQVAAEILGVGRIAALAGRD